MAEEKTEHKHVHSEEKTENKTAANAGAKVESKVNAGKESKSAVEKSKEEKPSKEKKNAVKIVLEREYVIPLRRKVQKAQRYRRAKKAIRVIREFLVKHMKAKDRDLRLVRVDKYLNQEIWYRGIKKPPARIKVRATKDSEGIVRVELADVPEKVKFDMARDKRKLEGIKHVAKHEEVKVEEKTEEQKEDIKEKEEATIEAGFAHQKLEAQQMKHTEQGKHANVTAPRRKSLKK
ncbi:MAG: 50S ribosomal protein L31e [archaeon]